MFDIDDDDDSSATTPHRSHSAPIKQHSEINRSSDFMDFSTTFDIGFRRMDIGKSKGSEMIRIAKRSISDLIPTHPVSQRYVCGDWGKKSERTVSPVTFQWTFFGITSSHFSMDYKSMHFLMESEFIDILDLRFEFVTRSLACKWTHFTPMCFRTFSLHPRVLRHDIHKQSGVR